MPTTIDSLSDLIAKLNCTMLSHLEQHLLREPTARDRILLLDDWCESVLHYRDFYQLLPVAVRDSPAVQVLQQDIAELLAPVEAFAAYLAAKHIDPLLKQELAELCV